MIFTLLLFKTPKQSMLTPWITTRSIYEIKRAEKKKLDSINFMNSKLDFMLLPHH